MSRKIILSLVGILALVGLFAGGTSKALADTATVSCNAATLYGTVTDVTGASMDAWFEWGRSSFAAQTPHQSFTSTQSYSETITGLSENVDYVWRAMAQDNSTGKIYTGNSMSFHTNPCNVVTNPTVTLTANPTTIQSGQNSTLTWSSQNATSCSAYWTNSSATSGTGIVVPTANTTYSITCYGTQTGQPVSAQATVNVTQATCQDTTANNYGGALPCTYTKIPTVTLTANPASVAYNGASMLTWTSTNAALCSATWGTNGWTGTKTLSGSFNTGALTNSTTFGITCQNSSGQEVQSSVTVNVTQATCQDSSATNFGGSLPCLWINPNPTVNIYANPQSVSYNGASTVSWSSTNAISCSATNGTNGWTGAKSTSGSFYTGALTNTSIFSINCTSKTGLQAFAATTISVGTIQTCQDTTANNYGGALPCTYTRVPTVTLSANPTSIQSGQNSTLSWSSQNATSCSAYWTNSSATSGSGIVVPTANTTYSITCYGTNGQPVSAQATVAVTQIINPTVTLTANPASIQSGQNSTLSWSSQNATSCSAYWTNSSATSGSGIVVPTSTTTYSITCYGTNGQQVSAQATVNVTQQTCQDTTANNYGGALPCTYTRVPTVTLTANPTSIQSGQNSTLSWSSQNATSCSAYWTNSSATSGSGIVVPTANTTYSITCYGTNGQPVSAQATVAVTQIQTCQDTTANNYGGALPCTYTQVPAVTIYANPQKINYNKTSTVVWSSTNAVSCSATGGSNNWAGTHSTSGSFYTGALISTTTYNITCINSNGQSANASTIVIVKPKIIIITL